MIFSAIQNIGISLHVPVGLVRATVAPPPAKRLGYRDRQYRDSWPQRRAALRARLLDVVREDRADRAARFKRKRRRTLEWRRPCSSNGMMESVAVCKLELIHTLEDESAAQKIARRLVEIKRKDMDRRRTR